MIRTWKMSTVIGLLAFILTFWLSISNNTWQTSLFRACIGFLLFFIWGYGIRYLLKFVLYSEPQNRKQSDIKIMNEEEKSSLDEAAFQAISLESLHTAEQPLNYEK